MKKTTKDNKDIKKMDETTSKTVPVDPVMLFGLALFAIYRIAGHFVGEVPDLLAYPWMIISIVCMLVGVFRNGKTLGRYFMNSDKDNDE